MANITIRLETPADYSAIRDLIVEVFTETYGAGETEAALVEQLRLYSSQYPNISLVAEKDDAVVGHIFFSSVTLKDHPEIPTCVLAPLGVYSKYQKQGVGSQLINAGLVECKKLGYKIVIVQGSLEYYPRFCFIPIGPTGLYTIFNSDHDMVLELSPGVLNKVSGLVDYPEPWHDLV